MNLLKNLIKGEYSIHLLAIGIWYFGVTFIGFIFEKYPSTQVTYKTETILYLFATSRFLQSLLSAVVLVGLFLALKKKFNKIGLLYFVVISISLSIYIATFYDLVGYINSGDCEQSYWCIRTYFDK